MKPEETARKKIDELLEKTGWNVQNYKQLNLGASLGVAVREFPLKKGMADYLLFVDRKAVGAIESKPEGTPLSGVTEQSGRYVTCIPETIPSCYDLLLPCHDFECGEEPSPDPLLDDISFVIMYVRTDHPYPSGSTDWSCHSGIPIEILYARLQESYPILCTSHAITSYTLL